VNYLWTPATGLDFDDVPNPMASPLQTTLYTVEVTSAEGCTAMAQVKVVVQCDTLIIPTGYSPNDDGINDYFEIVGIEHYPGNKLWVYNRWGSLLYKTVDYKNTWNGVSNVTGIYIGKRVPAGTYFWVLDLGNGSKPLQGYVVLRY
jgi:gliding motility-associated-like protein